MKSNKGITLVALIIMVVVISILAGLLVNTSMSAYRSAKVTQFVARMNMVQSKVNIAYASIKKGDITAENYGIQATDANSSLQDKMKTASGSNQLDQFRYLSSSHLKSDLDLENIPEDIIVNFNTREIYSLNGIKRDGKIYYNQYQLPGGEFNIKFSNKNQEAPDFQVEKQNYGLYTEILVKNITYKGNVGGGTIYYGYQTGENNGVPTVDSWKETTEKIHIEVSGTYAIKIIDKAGNETIKTVKVVLENAPSTTSDMTPVVYDESAKKWKKVNKDNMGSWFDYAENKWANIMMNDGMVVDSNGYVTSYGSMFVWLPRYAYNIKNNFHTNQAGTIEVKFLKGTTNLTTDQTHIPISTTSGNDKWLVHPAFQDGTKTSFSKGEWNCEIEGLWFAKFETSMETNGTHTDTNSVTTGDVLTSDTIKAVVKPGVSSWSYASVGTFYTNCYQYNRKANSHLIKNSEWGAMGYLAQSEYGRNGTPITIQNAFKFQGSTGSTTNGEAYNTASGVLGSTTGNVYGIYDVCGIRNEYTASYIAGGSSNLSQYGASFATKGISDQCATAYPAGSSVASNTGMSKSYSAWSQIYGDAIWEVSNGTGSNTAWGQKKMDDDGATSNNDNEPFFLQYLAGAICQTQDALGTPERSIASRIALVVTQDQ